jgi:hypothetical protein
MSAGQGTEPRPRSDRFDWSPGTLSIAAGTFAVGLLGLLAASTLHLTDAAVLLSSIAIGAIAGAWAGGRPAVGLLGLVLGLVASLPTALGLGVVASLSDTWTFGLGLVLALATVGFLGCVAVVRSVRARTTEWAVSSEQRNIHDEQPGRD